MTSYTPAALVSVLARLHTPQQLCELWAEVDTVSGEKYLDALASHAKQSSWGDLIEQSLNRWEDDSGLV